MGTRQLGELTLFINVRINSKRAGAEAPALFFLVRESNSY